MLPRSVLVAGGAGFIGSHLVERFVERGWRVAVVDPCHPRTGGAPRNLAVVEARIEWVRESVATADLDRLLARAELVVDAMGFTHHLEGLEDPHLDHELNYVVHLRLIAALRRCPRPLLYLGSRGQYGRAAGVIDEDHAQVPLDPQGVHKAATEAMIRIYSRRHGWPALSLRVGNCFGPRQPMGADPGLVGGFFATVMRGEELVIFGDRERRQQVLYVRDLSSIVLRLVEAPMEEFRALNVAGDPVRLSDLGEAIIAVAGRGCVSFRPFPPEIAAIHGGHSTISEARLRSVAPGAYTALPIAVRETYDALCQRHDLAL